MGGGLIQLVAYGAQDIYLTGQPQITFFKTVFKRYTNFAIESVQQSGDGRLYSNREVITLSRSGDLINNIYLQGKANPTQASIRMRNVVSTVPQEWNGPNPGTIGHSIKTASYDSFTILNSAELEIGGQHIDTIYSDWMVAYSELVYRKGQLTCYPQRTLIQYAANVTETQIEYLDNCSCMDPLALSLQGASVLRGALGTNTQRIFIPLLFWFNGNPGLSIPIIALQYHDVKLILNIANEDGYWTSIDATTVSTMEIWADYVFLDTTERKMFAENTHEYLITQHQRQQNNITNSTVDIKLDFNHPCKYITWWMSGNQYSGPKYVANAISLNSLYGSSWKLTLNGVDRFSERPFEYFQHFQPWQHWPTNSYGWSYASTTRVANVTTEPGSLCEIGFVPIGSLPNVYSFSLNPAEHQPSGTCNFSRFSDVRLLGSKVGTLTPGWPLQGSTLKIYVENYNILRIMGGTAGVLFAN